LICVLGASLKTKRPRRYALKIAMLNDLVIRKTAIPPAGAVQVADGRLPGFGLRVYSSGIRSFYLTYRHNGRSRRLSLGRYPFTTLSQARAKAHLALVELNRGNDPQSARPTRRDRFADVLDDFVAGYCRQHNRATTAAETERLLRRYFLTAWQRRGLADLTKADIESVLTGILERGKVAAARHAFAAVRKLFNWCIETGRLDASPCAGMKAPAKHNSRDRVLTDDELAIIWRYTGEHDDTAHTVIRLLLLTGQRTGEVCGMTWDEIDFERGIWTMAGSRTKNHKAHAVPLSTTALAILRRMPRTTSPLVFPARGKPMQPYAGYTKPKMAIDEATGVTGWTLHDLRRTAATGMARLGVSPHVIERILNHTGGSLGGVAGVYNRFKYMPEMTAALALWEKHLESIASP
jgi:integrase